MIVFQRGSRIYLEAALSTLAVLGLPLICLNTRYSKASDSLGTSMTDAHSYGTNAEDESDRRVSLQQKLKDDVRSGFDEAAHANGPLVLALKG